MKLFKNLIVAVTFFVVSSFGVSAVASEIGIIDTQKIMEKTKAIEGLRNQLNEKAEVFKKDSSKKEEYFKKKFEELDSKKNVLSKDAYEKKAKSLNEEFAEAQKKVQQDRSSLDKVYADAIKVFEENLDVVIKEVASSEKILVILPKMQTLYSDDSLDITEKVLEKINKRLTKINVKF